MKNDLPAKRQDSFQTILRFMTKADITLSAVDEEILSRWIYADVKMRTKKYREEEIIDHIRNQYKVSEHTARNDIYNAQKLFAKTRLVQKRYLIAQHLERIDQDIEKTRSNLFTEVYNKKTKKNEIVFDAKEMAAYSLLLKVYTYTLNSMPEESEKNVLPPPIFHWNLPPGVTLNKPHDTKSALESADEYLKLNDDGVYEPGNNSE